MAKVFLESADAAGFHVANLNESVYGTSGLDKVVVDNGASVTTDQNVEKVLVNAASSAYTYQRVTNTLYVYSNTTTLVGKIAVAEGGTSMVYTDGKVLVTISGANMLFGGQVVTSAAPTTITGYAIDSSESSTGSAAGRTIALTAGINQGSDFVGAAGNDTFTALLDSTAGVATLNAFDSIDGAGGVNTLSLTDAKTGDATVLPTGITLANIQKVLFQTVGNAGNVVGTSDFDISTFASVTDLTISSAGTTADAILAAATQNVTDTNVASGVTVTGGLSDTVTAKGSIVITGVAGAVVASNTDTTGSSVAVDGGTSVNVTTKGTSGVAVGATTAPAGAVTVTDNGGGTISIKGGTTANVTANVYGGGAITIGANAATGSPSGAITITQRANAADVTTYGGASTNVSTIGGGGAGNVVVGGATKPALGAIVITDANTNRVANADVTTVLGGSTVNITTTPTSGTISVGTSTATLNTAGTGLLTTVAAQDPTGAVVISNAVTNGTATTYGTSDVKVYTNGSSSVTLTGGAGGAILIKDMNTTLDVGGVNPVAASTLATVSLTGVSGAVQVTSNALANLTIANSLTANTATAVTVTDTTAGHALAVTLNGNTNVSTTVTDAIATSVTINTAGTTADNLILAAAKVTSLTFNNSTADVTMGATTSLAKVTSITASGTNAVAFTDSAANTPITTTIAPLLTSITGGTGAVTVTLDPTLTAFSGGAGSDVITLIGTTLPTKLIAGGTGSNTLVIDAASETGFGSSLYVTGFQTLGMGALANGNFDATGFTGLSVAGTTVGNSVFTNVAAGATLNISAASGNDVTYKLAADTAADTLNLTIGNSAGAVANSGKFVYGDSVVASGTSTGIETLAITSSGKSTVTNTLKYSDGQAAGGGTQAITIGGTTALTLTDADATVKTITVTNTKAVNVSAVVLKDGAATTSITGGAGLLTADLNTSRTSTTNIDTITTGTGGGTITVGVAGQTSWNVGLAAIAYAGGSTTLNLGNSLVADSITIGNKDFATINGFTVFNNAGTTPFADSITVGATPEVLLTNATSAGTVYAGLSYTVSNGVITFIGTPGVAELSSFTLTQLLSAAGAIVTAADAANAAGSGNAIVSAFESNGKTYLVSSDVAADGAIELATLNATTGVTGIGNSKAAGGTLAITGASFTNATKVGPTPAAATAADHTTASAGYIAATLAFTDASAVAGTKTETFSNLAAAGTLTISNSHIVGGATGSHIGQVATTQVGAAGTNYLTLNLASTAVASEVAVVVDKMTVTGAYGVTINASEGAGATAITDVITSLVDGGATPTLKTITIANGLITGTSVATPLTISAITDSALTTIDASAATAAVTLSSVTNNGVTINAANGATTTITAANGSAVKVLQASGTGIVTGTFNGDGDTITLSATGGANNFTANGVGDIITVGTAANTIVATGVGTSVTVTAASTTGNSITVGKGASVTLATGAAADTVNLAAAVGNDLTTNLVTITNASPTDATNDLIVFAAAGTHHAAVGQINVGAATTLAQALDIAIVNDGHTVSGDSYLSWFQYGGATYVVDHVATGVTATDHTFQATTDTVVKLAGVIAIDTFTVAGATLTL